MAPPGAQECRTGGRPGGSRGMGVVTGPSQQVPVSEGAGYWRAVGPGCCRRWAGRGRRLAALAVCVLHVHEKGVKGFDEGQGMRASGRRHGKEGRCRRQGTRMEWRRAGPARVCWGLPLELRGPALGPAGLSPPHQRTAGLSRLRTSWPLATSPWPGFVPSNSLSNHVRKLLFVSRKVTALPA